jgi:SAM-dependent methyltransferase
VELRGADPDVWGAIIGDVLDGRRAHEIVERDDGYVMAFDASYLVAPLRRWDDPLERRAMRLVRGRVLDVGCGAGRACLHLQARGLEVVGIDPSPGAIEHCRARGVRDARVLSVDQVDSQLGVFDTILFLGQNLGLLRSKAHAPRVLGRLTRIAAPGGRVVAETFDPHAQSDAVNVGYRRRNLARGRMPGQLRVRIRHRELATPWFDWLQLSPAELDELADGTGWRLARTLGDGPSYVAVLVRDGPGALG